MQKTRFPAVISTFIVCYIFWLLLTWPFGADGVAVQELVAGGVVSLAVALFSARFFIHEKSFWLFNPAKFFSLIAYAFGTFFSELIKANCDMAKRCYGGCKDVNPGIVKIPVDVESEYGQAMLANSITLTPGTITMDIAEEEGKTYYYVHWIDVKSTGEEAGEAIKGKLERGVRRVFR
ncbi:MAG: Na+/H+ antiporter subunit E [Eubacteriales bacterium]|nr:Na+/H+ antiporter subunit E [Eubacteriales bacterium]